MSDTLEQKLQVVGDVIWVLVIELESSASITFTLNC